MQFQRSDLKLGQMKSLLQPDTLMDSDSGKWQHFLNFEMACVDNSRSFLSYNFYVLTDFLAEKLWNLLHTSPSIPSDVKRYAYLP